MTDTSQTAVDAAKLPTLADKLQWVIAWLEGGCDPQHAAKELRAIAAQPQVAVPGWKLVPIDPDEEMLEAGRFAHYEAEEGVSATGAYEAGGMALRKNRAGHVFKAMIAAAPVAGQQDSAQQSEVKL